MLLGVEAPMATNAVTKQPAETEKKKRHRSPNYPTVGLKEAIERLKKFMLADGRAGASPEIAAKHIGFATAHGLAYSVLSALKKFDLVADKDGRVVPTRRAIEITSLPETDERRVMAIRQAAFLPQIYSELIEQYRVTGLPSDETLEGELKAYKGFNPNAVKEFIKAFRETLDFAGLTDLSVLGLGTKAEKSKKVVEIGDYVQWEPNGILQFHEPRRVRSISEGFVFVDGSLTGMPLAEVTVQEAPANPPKPHVVTPVRVVTRNSGGSATMRQDVFSLTEGEVILNWPTPLSQESIEEFTDWLDLVKRRVIRATKPVTEPPEESKSETKPQEPA
jgi:hypothetical protein